MTAHVLDNPIWGSLSTLHRGLALAAGEGLRYPAEVAPFVGVPRAGGAAGLEGDDPLLLLGPVPAAPGGWQLGAAGGVVEMVWGGPLGEREGGAAVVPVHERGAVLELTALVYPHYFRPRTMELG